MVNSIRLKSVVSVANTEYQKWLRNPRNLVVGVLLLFSYTLATQTLLEHAAKYGESIHVLEPFIAVGNSGLLVLLIPCVYLIMISDYPVVNGHSLLFIRRCGRINWILGHLLFLVFSILTYLGSLLVFLMLFSQGVWLPGWSNVVKKYDLRFPNERDSFASELIPPNVYNHLSVKEAVLHTVLLVSLYLLILALILYLCKIKNMRAMGLFLVFCVIAAGVATTALKVRAMWLFPMANSIVWLHFDMIMVRESTLWKSYAYLLAVVLLLIGGNIAAAGKMSFCNVEHEGES